MSGKSNNQHIKCIKNKSVYRYYYRYNIRKLFQFLSRYMRCFFLILFTVLCQCQFLSICFVYTRVIVGFSTVFTLHCNNNSSSLFLCHKIRIIINKAILNDGFTQFGSRETRTPDLVLMRDAL